MRCTPRLRWKRAVASPQFPPSERAIRATLLMLVDLMTSNGELQARRDEITDATGLPGRTVDRHLQRAVEAGWLVHLAHGGRGRMAVYQATIPTYQNSRIASHEWRAIGGNSAPPTRGLSAPNSAPPSGALNKESASDSEHVAVHRNRGRRNTHDDSRGPRLVVVASEGGDDKPSGRPLPVAASRPARTARPPPGDATNRAPQPRLGGDHP